MNKRVETALAVFQVGRRALSRALADEASDLIIQNSSSL